jgi:hypothetical protein
MAMTLTWSRDRVTGTGSVNAVPAPARCGSTVVEGLSTLTLAAARSSSTEIRGTMTIGDAITVTYQGALAGTTHIDGVLVAPDGTECALTLFKGLVP